MKKVFCIGISCLVLLLVSACSSTSVTTTTTPLVYTNNESTKFEILGEILYESKERAGFVGLLRAARNLYPDCDYVIDIMAEQRITTTTNTTSYFPLFFMKDKQSVDTEVTWIMRGTAIKYIR
jgi:hypothetical protein